MKQTFMLTIDTEHGIGLDELEAITGQIGDVITEGTGVTVLSIEADEL